MHEIKETIPVVLAADNNYIIPLVVTIKSVLRSAKPNTEYSITILVDESFDEKNFLRIIDADNKSVFSFVNVDKKLLNQAFINNEGLSVFTYGRLLIPQLLPEIEKCIYLDTDIVVLEDLSSMYKINMEEYYIAGVKDYAIQNLLKNRVWEIENLEIPNERQYVNAGILVLNLKKIREEKIDLLFLDNIGKKWRLEDQDILNKCCYGKITFLELKYNLFYRYYKNVQFFEDGFYSNQELEEAEKNPAIIHYTGSKMKPWKNTRIRASKLWWEVAETVLSGEKIQEQRRNVALFETNIKWEYILNQCKGKKIVIFGFSAIGRKVYGWLKNSNIEVCFFCDNDRTKEGTIYENIEVRALASLTNEEETYTFLIVSQNAASAIRKQLSERNIHNAVTYYDKGEYYYMALDNKYYEEEMVEIEKKENLKREFFTKGLEEKFWMDRWIYCKREK